MIDWIKVLEYCGICCAGALVYCVGYWQGRKQGTFGAMRYWTQSKWDSWKEGGQSD